MTSIARNGITGSRSRAVCTNALRKLRRATIPRRTRIRLPTAYKPRRIRRAARRHRLCTAKCRATPHTRLCRAIKVMPQIISARRRAANRLCISNDPGSNLTSVGPLRVHSAAPAFRYTGRRELTIHNERSGGTSSVAALYCIGKNDRISIDSRRRTSQQNYMRGNPSTNPRHSSTSSSSYKPLMHRRLISRHSLASLRIAQELEHPEQLRISKRSRRHYRFRVNFRRIYRAQPTGPPPGGHRSD